MTNNIRNIIPDTKQKLISKIKKDEYNFNKTEFKKFQDFFLKEFSNVNPDEVRERAWRTR